MLSRFPSFIDFCSRFSAANLTAAARHPEQSVTCASPTLTYINLAYGDGCAIAWLIVHLTHFQEQINVPNKMTPLQLETCAQVIFDSYHHLKSSELMLFFARLSGGAYSIQWHGYITPDKIISALRDQFLPWRNNVLRQHHQQQQARQLEADLQNTITYEQYLQLKNSPSDPLAPIDPLTPLKQKQQ